MRLVMKWASRGSLPFMKMLYPRKMDEVLWHSTTCLFSKSIFVKMPRLPTMRVIGSQFISTRFPFFPETSLVGAVIVLIRSLLFLLGGLSGIFCSVRASSVRSGMVSGRQFSARMTPLRFLVDGRLRNRSKRANGPAISAYGCAGKFPSGRFVHERHELVGKARHGAADADAAHVGAASDSRHPAALRNVAVHHRPPASQLHDALGRTVHFGEITLLVIAGAIAAFVNRLAEQPRRAQLIVERNHGRKSRHLIEQVEDGLHKVVGLHRASRNIHDGQPSLGPPIPAEVIRQSHSSCGIAFHRVNAAVGRAGAAGYNCQRFRREAVDPLVGGNRLAGFRVSSETCPIAFLLNLLVWD